MFVRKENVGLLVKIMLCFEVTEVSYDIKTWKPTPWVGLNEVALGKFFSPTQGLCNHHVRLSVRLSGDRIGPEPLNRF